MFDIGFAELILVAIVGLLVLGPDRLPGAIRTVALYIGRIRRGFNQVRSEFEREIGADEIRRQLHNESILNDLQKGKEQLKALQNDLRQLDGQVKHASQSVENSIDQAVNAPAKNSNVQTPETLAAPETLAVPEKQESPETPAPDLTSSENKQAKAP